MKLLEIITEGRDAPLYHMMDARKSESIFRNDTMYAVHQHMISGQLIWGISFTRFAQRWQRAFGSVWLELNQTKLAQSHKIIPVDGEFALATKCGMADADKHRDRQSEQFSEEFVVGDINNLHSYILSMTVLHTKEYRYLARNAQASFDQTCTDYANRWNIPIKIVGPNHDINETKIRKAAISSKQAAVLSALAAGANIVRDKSPPYRWENANAAFRPQIPTATVDKLLKSGKVKMVPIEARYQSHRLVLTITDPGHGLQRAMGSPGLTEAGRSNATSRRTGKTRNDPRLHESKVYQVDCGYTMPVAVFSNPSPPQARTLIASVRKHQTYTYLRGLMVKRKVYVWDGNHLTHNDVLSKLLPDVPDYTSDLSTFEIQDYTIRGYGTEGFHQHQAKFHISKPGDYDPETSPFVRNVMTAIDTFKPVTEAVGTWSEIRESYFATQQINDDSYQGSIDIFQNPSRAELGGLIREFGFVRGIFDEDSVYVWRGDVLHDSVDVPGEYKIMWTGNKQVEVQWDFGEDAYGGAEPTPEESASVKAYILKLPKLRPLLLRYAICIVSQV